MLGNEGLLGVDDLVDTEISVERGLSVFKGDDGSVSSSTAELALAGKSRRETDGIVEGETKRLVNLFTTFAAIE